LEQILFCMLHPNPKRNIKPITSKAVKVLGNWKLNCCDMWSYGMLELTIAFFQPNAAQQSVFDGATCHIHFGPGFKHMRYCCIRHTSRYTNCQGLFEGERSRFSCFFHLLVNLQFFTFFQELTVFVFAGIIICLLDGCIVSRRLSPASCISARVFLSLGPAFMYSGLLTKTLRIAIIFQSKKVLQTHVRMFTSFKRAC